MSPFFGHGVSLSMASMSPFCGVNVSLSVSSKGESMSPFGANVSLFSCAVKGVAVSPFTTSRIDSTLTLYWLLTALPLPCERSEINPRVISSGTIRCTWRSETPATLATMERAGKQMCSSLEAARQIAINTALSPSVNPGTSKHKSTSR